MWASHFVRNGNKLSSSWLTTEIIKEKQGSLAGNSVGPHSGRMWAYRIPGQWTLFLFYFLPIHSWITILCNNRQPKQRLLLLAQPQPRFLKYTASDARTATAVLWKLTTDPSLKYNIQLILEYNTIISSMLYFLSQPTQ